MALLGATALVLSACADDADNEATEDVTTPEATESEEPTEEDTTDEGDDSEEPAGRDYASIDASDYTACLVSDAGGWDDKSFNESAFNGLQEAVELMGVNAQTAESSSDGDFGPNVNAMVAEGCNLVIGVGFLLEEATGSAALENPDVSFALVDSGFTTESDNARPLLFNTAEAAFLAGYVAGGMTETGVVATFGGLPIPSVQIFMDGFYDGVMAYNEANGADVEVLGWDKDAQTGSFSNSFDDQAQGQQLANGFINQGADIIMPVAGPVGLGAAAAAQSAGDVWIIGVDSDWYESASEFSSIILTSVLKDIDVSVLDTIADVATGEFSSEPYIGTLENGGVDIAPFHDFEADVPAELVAEVDALREQIISGELVIETPNAP
ncbi:BMP family ABC transporter substrate-binding protein [Flaviflexus sp. JY899]|uniref:BMP family ABC transporter substrate-binding protein n=2 Tax=Flaviflexus equikiangi TaxID=2758573 RepID=A0ABS2TF00_9ACTO|nr:BMP family ABC transporter substrate-binding protein [Flaviflexus equikiangi]MBM9432948.1 BMP family ABC transporter substrate-binding protein [Flaviflexus equikiangi]